MTVALAYAGPITLYTNQAAFEAATGAIQVPIPSWASVYSATCGSPIGQTGSGGPVSMTFDSNVLTMSAAMDPLNAGCIFDAGAVIPSGNTVPDTMIANTFVANGEDDYVLAFDQPVGAVGFRLLTNNVAYETVTFRNAENEVIDVVNVSDYTSPNTRQFLGFKSHVPVTSVFIDTSGGDIQNEGIDLLEASSVPDPGSTLLLFGISLVGLRAWRKR